MSFGSYDNQAPLNQPFNPTADTGIGSEFGRTIGNTVVKSLFGQPGQGSLTDQGALTNLVTDMTGTVINKIAGRDVTSGAKNFLPGAPAQSAQPPLTPQQTVDQSQAGGGILKLRQQPPMFNSGKSGGKAFGAPNMYNQTQPDQTQTDANQTMGRPDITYGTPSSIYSPAMQPVQQPGGKSAGR